MIEFAFHRPPVKKILGEKIPLVRFFVGEVTPTDIVPPGQRDALFRQYPDLAGDWTAIGPGDDGNCQSWCGDPGWWKKFTK